ncbi:MAG TPA: TGS domain-containing protein [Micromonosporaceae bacterium]|nr:TGS domain-containing protein [Micromonosporaceae bacterium]
MLRPDRPADEIHVYTPEGDAVGLPAGSTPVDVAYTVHTDIGHKCIGATVNGKLVPLESTLSDGDLCEVFTARSDTAGPNRDWLGFVRTSRAAAKIRAYFDGADDETFGDSGLLRLNLARAGFQALAAAVGDEADRVVPPDTLALLADRLGDPDAVALLAAIATGDVAAHRYAAQLIAVVDTG